MEDSDRLIKDCLTKIEEIAAVMQAGDQVTYQSDPRGLRWVWSRADETWAWSIYVPHVNRIGRLRGLEDPIYLTILDFCRNKIDAVQTMQRFARLKKLKVFW
jgi:hypothetical protein